MKFLVSFTSSVLAAMAILSVIPCMGETEIYNNVLRLHVIAESDSPKAQELKLKVRDAVLSCVSDEIENCTSFDEAYSTIADMESKIIETAENCVIKNGSVCKVTMELGVEKYPRRNYGDATLPAGEYNSLKIILGDGEGKNWWCVLFPSVCMGFAKNENEYAAVGFTPREYRIITGKGSAWKVRFRILEVLSEIIGFEYE